MKKCAQCDAELDPTWKFCIFCGTAVRSDAAPENTSPKLMRPPRPFFDDPPQTPELDEPIEPSDAIEPSEPPEELEQSAVDADTGAETGTDTDGGTGTETHADTDTDNPFVHALPPRPQPPQNRSEAMAAATQREAERALATAAAKAEARALHEESSARSAESTQREAATQAEPIPAAFRNTDAAPPSRRRVDVPLVVSVALGAAGVVLIVYLAILVFGTRG